MSKISIGIICKNAAQTIQQTLESVKWVDEIIVIDDHSTDSTVDIVKKYTQNITTANVDTFADKRNMVLKNLESEWILYVDADEVVTPELKDSIIEIITANSPAAYSVNRRNFFLGTEMYADRIDRLFHRSVINGWTGAVHESPALTVKSKPLKASLLHYTHQTIQSMLAKTNQWSDIEADLRIKANHPPMAWWRLVRIAMTEGWKQFMVKRIGRYGESGIFEGYFQIVDKLIVYTKLWERQHQNP